MTDTQKKEDEKFNAALKRMLKTPPGPKAKSDDKSRRPKQSHQDFDDSGDAE